MKQRSERHQKRRIRRSRTAEEIEVGQTAQVLSHSSSKLWWTLIRVTERQILGCNFTRVTYSQPTTLLPGPWCFRCRVTDKTKNTGRKRWWWQCSIVLILNIDGWPCTWRGFRDLQRCYSKLHISIWHTRSNRHVRKRPNNCVHWRFQKEPRLTKARGSKSARTENYTRGRTTNALVRRSIPRSNVPQFSLHTFTRVQESAQLIECIHESKQNEKNAKRP